MTVVIPEGETADDEAGELATREEEPACADPPVEAEAEPPELGETDAPERRPVPQPTGFPSTMTVSVGSVCGEAHDQRMNPRTAERLNLRSRR